MNAAHSLNARLQIERGDFETGTKLLRAALDTGNRTGWTIWYPEFLGAMATGLAGLGRIAEAIATVSEGLARAERGGETYYVPELLRIKGGDTSSRGSFAAAEGCFHEALDPAQLHDALFWELRAAMSLARHMRGHRAAAGRAILVSAYERFTEGFQTADMIEARALLGPS